MVSLDRRLARLETISTAADGECTCTTAVGVIVDWNEHPDVPTPSRCPVCGGLVRVLVIDEQLVFGGGDD